MINKISDAVCIKIGEVFSQGYSIYTETVEQGFSEPCFFIKLLDFLQTRQVGNRFLCKHKFDIQYYPKGPNKNQEVLDVLAKICDVLEFVTDTIGDVYMGNGMSYEIIEEILHFYVNFDFYIYKVEDVSDNMEGLAIRFE